jgi:hypothetical protein
MDRDPKYPAVTLKDLVPDSCNFKDKTFERHVEHFMRDHMPGFPMGLLDTNSDQAYERWQIEPQIRYVVKTVTITIYRCSECETEHAPSEYEKLPDGVCCALESLGSQGRDGDEEPASVDREEKDILVLVDTEYVGEPMVDDAGDTPFEIEGRSVPVEGWELEDERSAERKAEELNRESQNESGYGFPWANSWAYMPEDFIETDELTAAGFVVAKYTGGKGNPREDEDFRLAGIDGGGYAFAGSHFARLTAIVSQRRNWLIETDNGKAYLEDEP